MSQVYPDLNEDQSMNIYGANVLVNIPGCQGLCFTKLFY